MKNYVIKFEKIDAGKYQLVERWYDEEYKTTLENELSHVWREGHKWYATFFGNVERCKTLKSAIAALRKTYPF